MPSRGARGSARACRLTGPSRVVAAAGRELASSRNLRRPARGVPSRQPRMPDTTHASRLARRAACAGPGRLEGSGGRMCMCAPSAAALGEQREGRRRGGVRRRVMDCRGTGARLDELLVHAERRGDGGGWRRLRRLSSWLPASGRAAAQRSGSVSPVEPGRVSPSRSPVVPQFLAGGRIGFTGGTVWSAQQSRGSAEPPSSELRTGTSSRSPAPPPDASVHRRSL